MSIKLNSGHKKKLINCIYLFYISCFFRVITYIKRRRRVGFFYIKKIGREQKMGSEVKGQK